jgi:hypothetical protein
LTETDDAVYREGTEERDETPEKRLLATCHPLFITVLLSPDEAYDSEEEADDGDSKE